MRNYDHVPTRDLMPTNARQPVGVGPILLCTVLSVLSFISCMTL